jgi:hypothetical protein
MWQHGGQWAWAGPEAGVSSSLVATRGCLTLTPPKKTTGRVVPDFTLKLTIILNVLFILFQTL